CIVVTGSSRSRRQTEAGFPRNGVAVKASTMYRGSWCIGSLLHTVVGRGVCEKRGFLLYSTARRHQVLQPTRCLCRQHKGLAMSTHCQTVLVTDAAGFVGSHVCKRLVALGHRVIGLDNYFTGSREMHVEGVEYRVAHTKDIASRVPEIPDLLDHLGE